ncbi:MAG: plastocyanin/azurin family copper-binding protein [Longimicrobiales bacterium]
MRSFSKGAPAHSLRGCAGVVFCGLFVVTGCREVAQSRPVVLELESDTITLPAGARVVEIEVARKPAGEFQPASTSARVGDVVRFVAKDGHSHAIVFDAGVIIPDGAAFLERTGQLRGPPLVHDGATWLVSLDGAPPGEYGFNCLTHAGRGSIRVELKVKS